MLVIEQGPCVHSGLCKQARNSSFVPESYNEMKELSSTYTTSAECHMKCNTVASGVKSDGSSQMKNGASLRAFIYFSCGLKMLYPCCPILDLVYERKLIGQ